MCGDLLGVRRSKLRCARCAGARGGPNGDRRWVRRARKQITFDYLDTDSGEVRRGKITPATRVELRQWLERFAGHSTAFAVEGCTGWRFVVEELQAAGIEAHVAEPADTAALRGPEEAGQDRSARRSPSASAAARRLDPGVVDSSRCMSSRLAPRSVSTRRWSTNARAGSSGSTPSCSTTAPQPSQDCSPLRAELQLKAAELSPAGRDAVDVALHMIEAITAPASHCCREIAAIARRQPGCRALRAHYGVGARDLGGDLGRARRLPPLLVF